MSRADGAVSTGERIKIRTGIVTHHSPSAAPLSPQLSKEVSRQPAGQSKSEFHAYRDENVRTPQLCETLEGIQPHKGPLFIASCSLQELLPSDLRIERLR